MALVRVSARDRHVGERGASGGDEGHRPLEAAHPRNRLRGQAELGRELVLEVAVDEIEAVREVVVRTMEEPPFAEFTVPLLVETKVAEAWS